MKTETINKIIKTLDKRTKTSQEIQNIKREEYYIIQKAQFKHYLKNLKDE